MTAPQRDASHPSDRRRHDRRACQISLTGRAGSRQAAVTAVDLSLTGARVVLPADWSAQWITLSGEGLRSNSTVRAQVVWKQPLDSGEMLAGIHFLEDPSRLGPTWVSQHLRREGLVRRRRIHQALPCDRAVNVSHPSHREGLRARLVSLSAAGAELGDMPYLPIGSLVWLEIPFDELNKRLKVQAQVVRQARQGQGWRLAVQLLLAEEAGEHILLQRILREIQTSRM